MKPFLLILAVMCVGCGGTGTGGRYPHDLIKADVQLYGIGAVYDVREFRLKDGTRCVALSETGITCDWQHPSIERDEGRKM